MPGHSRSKNGVASLAYDPAFHVLLAAFKKDVDARHKAGHDVERLTLPVQFVAGDKSLADSSGVRPLASALAKFSSILTPFGSNRNNW